MFCKRCGSLLKQDPQLKVPVCSQGHTQLASPVIFTTGSTAKMPIKVSSGENELAVYDHVCKRCGHGKAQLIEISCSYTDEDNYYQMKCGKCKFVEQLEGKVR